MHTYLVIFMRIFLSVAVIAVHSVGSVPDFSAMPSKGPALGKVEYARRIERAAVLRSLLLRHPTWTNAEFAAAANPQLEAAGLEAYTIKSIAEQLQRLRRQVGLPTTPPRVVPDYLSFLKAQFAENHKQSAGEVISKVQAKFGADAVKPSRVAGWWHNARHRMYHKPVRRSAPVPPPVFNHTPVKRSALVAPPGITSTVPADAGSRDWREELDRLLSSFDDGGAARSLL